jgi:hypothetical protein
MLFESFFLFLYSISSPLSPPHQQVFEDASSSHGVHFSEARKFWAAYRAFEEKQLPNKITQDNAVTNLFKREIGIPFEGVDLSFAEFKAFQQKHKLSAPDEKLNSTHQQVGLLSIVFGHSEVESSFFVPLLSLLSGSQGS